jgi:hypothetical protein
LRFDAYRALVVACVEIEMKQPMFWFLLSLLIIFAANFANERSARDDALINAAD